MLCHARHVRNSYPVAVAAGTVVLLALFGTLAAGRLGNPSYLAVGPNAADSSGNLRARPAGISYRMTPSA